MHTKHLIEDIDARAGVLNTQDGIRFLLATPVPDFVFGWKAGDQIWVSEAGRDFDLRTVDRMDEIASAVRVRSKSDS